MDLSLAQFFDLAPICVLDDGCRWMNTVKSTWECEVKFVQVVRPLSTRRDYDLWTAISGLLEGSDSNITFLARTTRFVFQSPVGPSKWRLLSHREPFPVKFSLFPCWHECMERYSGTTRTEFESIKYMLYFWILDITCIENLNLAWDKCRKWSWWYISEQAMKKGLYPLQDWPTWGPLERRWVSANCFRGEDHFSCRAHVTCFGESWHAFLSSWVR